MMDIKREQWVNDLINSNSKKPEQKTYNKKQKESIDSVLSMFEFEGGQKNDLSESAQSQGTFSSRPVTVTGIANVPKNSVVADEEGSSDTLFEGTNSRNGDEQEPFNSSPFLQKYKGVLIELGLRTASTVLSNSSIKIDIVGAVKFFMDFKENPTEAAHRTIETLNKYPETIKLMDIFGGYDLLMSKLVDDADLGIEPDDQLYMNLIISLNEIVESNNFILLLKDLGLMKEVKQSSIDEGFISQAVEKYLKTKAATEINKVINSAIDKGIERWTEHHQTEMGKMNTELSKIISKTISNVKEMTPEELAKATIIPESTKK